ncbi:prephenate dehydrogenase/arogenate dehydrogenase family protein [Bosea lathyri]|uniref:Prephenate dehydrogenase n=1 Tax=Bosea lathyri TaxID=1036778 RepID=A0A1H5WY16_9HYPH|nr:prephenate dehydrogenase/arogenate dehydrogenase family protein [Bosea lathyri]SEG04392.1 prephenate dehydrogenase [Bosea lathyri]
MTIGRKTTPSIGIIGFGAFGRLIARHLAPHSPLVVSDPCQSIPQESPDRVVVSDARGAARCDIVILAVPVDRMSAAIAELKPHLRPGAVVIDVGSVKIEPARIMLAELPENVEIIGTHPLFGPQSASRGIAGLKMALCPIRGKSWRRIAAFLRQKLKLDVILTTPDAHDRDMAMVQGLTHLVAKILVRMEPMPGRMTTRSFELLMQATEMVRHDAPGVFHAIERANPHARAVRERFFAHAQEITRELERGHEAQRPAAREIEAEIA